VLTGARAFLIIIIIFLYLWLTDRNQHRSGKMRWISLLEYKTLYVCVDIDISLLLCPQNAHTDLQLHRLPQVPVFWLSCVMAGILNFLSFLGSIQQVSHAVSNYYTPLSCERNHN